VLESKTYDYDVHNQLISAARYIVGSTTPYESWAFITERGHRVVEIETDHVNDERTVNRRLIGPGVDQVLAVDNEVYDTDTSQLISSKLIWTLTDRQGTVRDLYELATDTRDHVSYAVFGTPANTGGLAGTANVFYAGRELDPDTGLYYNRARWYDSDSARFISEDPSSFTAGDPNLYRYCGNSPMNATDPSGNFAITVPVLLAGGAYLAWRGGESAAETYVEYQVAEYMGDESFSAWGAFGRNMTVNTAIGWMPGAVEGKIAFKTARLGAKIGGRSALKAGYYSAKYGTEYVAETTVETGYETLVNGRNFSDALWQASIGNAIGHGVFRPAAHYAGRGVSVSGRWLRDSLEIVPPSSQPVFANMAGLGKLTEYRIQRKRSFIASEGGLTTLRIQNKFDAGSYHSRQLQRFVRAWNEEIANVGGQMARRTLTDAEERASDIWKRMMRQRYPARFKGKVVGHVPDAGAGGRAVPDRAMALSYEVNSYLGGLLNGIAVGTKYNAVELFR